MDSKTYANATKEINRRKSACCYILKRMHNFWRHSDCSMGFKLHVLNAIIRSKLMYGLESAVLSPSVLEKLNTFQLKGIRKILHIETTWGQMQQGKARTNKNEVVYIRANEALNAQGPIQSLTKN